MSLQYDPSSEPLHISAKWLYANEAGTRNPKTEILARRAARGSRIPKPQARSPTPWLCGLQGHLAHKKQPSPLGPP